METSALAAIGLLLGALTAAGTLIAMAVTSASVSGSAVVGVPWLVAGVVALTVLLGDFADGPGVGLVGHQADTGVAADGLGVAPLRSARRGHRPSAAART